VKIDRDC